MFPDTLWEKAECIIASVYEMLTLFTTCIMFNTLIIL